MKGFMVAVMLVALCGASWAWDGVDQETGADVEIGRGNLVRRGRTIEVYDYGRGEYRDVEVEGVRDRGNRVEVDVYDPETGESSTLEMDRN